jgi:hypothetical protein
MAESASNTTRFRYRRNKPDASEQNTHESKPFSVHDDEAGFNTEGYGRRIRFLSCFLVVSPCAKEYP